ncbi:glycosyltransferase family 2 protein [Elusimicrobiota bacterium]
MSKKISFIVPVTRKTECLKLLDSIKANNIAENMEYEIILVMNPDIDLHDDIKNDTSIKLISCDNMHTSHRRNYGVINSCGDYIAFLDDDIILHNTWISTVASYLDKGYDILFGPTESCGKDFTQALSDKITILLIREAHTKNHKKEKLIPKLDKMYTCNCAMKRNVWEQTAGFNEVADYHVDDIEFFYIAEKLGFKIISVKKASAYHKKRKFLLPFFSYLFSYAKASGMNAVLFPEIYRHSGWIKSILLSFIVFPFIIFIKYELMFYFFISYLAAMSLYILINAGKFGLYTVLMPFVMIFVHIDIYIAFLTGFFSTLLHPGKHKAVKEHKIQRYRKI